MQKAKLLAKSKLTTYILLPFILYAIPLDNILNGESICLWKQCFGIECWGCGITRAIFLALHGYFIEAWKYNKLYVVVMPLLMYIWLHNTYNLLKTTINKGH